jgi:hypothetical protein
MNTRAPVSTQHEDSVFTIRDAEVANFDKRGILGRAARPN